MTGILDTVQRASFAGIAFACEDIDIKGGLRDEVHEYRHTPGGEPEIQGRKLYTFEFNAIYSSTMLAYPKAFPDDWDSHRLMFEQGIVGKLVVPTLGTIEKAYCTDWPVHIDYKKFRDGIRVKLAFREDSLEAVIGVDADINAPALYWWTTPFIEEVAAAGLELSLFDAIMKLLADIEAAKDFAEFQVELYLDKVSALIDTCISLEESVAELGQPENWKVAKMIRGIGVTAMRLKEDSLRKFAPMIDYVTPGLMSIVEISMALYNDTSHVMDLLALNRDPIIKTPFSILPGTTIRAYSPQLEGVGA